MKAKIHFEPKYRLKMEKETLKVIMDRAASHYDGVCKASVKIGGLLYAWKNCIDYGTWCFATHRELDLVLKICERCGIEGPEQRVLDGVSAFIREVMRQGQDNAMGMNEITLEN